MRVVLDRSLRISGTSRLVHSGRETPLWVMTSNLAEAPAAMKLGAAGAQVIRVATTGAGAGTGSVDCGAGVGGEGYHPALGGRRRRVASSFVAADLVDEVWLLRGPDPVGANGIAALEQCR